MMNYLARIAAFTWLFVLSAVPLFSQDSAVYTWSVSSKKIAENKYELIFSTIGAHGWQLYSPAQTVPDLVTTELKFGDSAITQQGTFKEDGALKDIKSQAWDGQIVKVYDGPANWKTVISIAGTVPARLQGELSYGYGRGIEFYTATFPFAVPLEGGITADIRIKIPTI